MVSGESKLCRAVKSSYWETARSILRDESNQNQVEYVDSRGMNALHYACLDPCTPFDLVQAILLASQSPPLCQDNNGDTPLHAVWESSDDIILMLIRACPQAASMVNKYGETPLHRAIFRNRATTVIRALLSANPSATRAVNKRGRTPLHEFFETWYPGLEHLLASIPPHHFSTLPLIHQMYVKALYSRKKKVTEIYEQVILLLKTYFHSTVEDLPESKPFHQLHSLLKINPCPKSFFSLFLMSHPEEKMLKDEDGNLPLHLSASARGNDASGIFCTLLKFDYGAASVPNNEGRLPLNIALECDKYPKEKDLKAVLRATPHFLGTRDMKTHFLPFMLAAAAANDDTMNGNQSDEESLLQLSTVFFLLREDPSYVAWALPVKKADDDNPDLFMSLQLNDQLQRRFF